MALPYALSGLVNGQPPSYRQLTTANDALNSGEVLFVGVIPPDTVWDTSLKGGVGGLRSRTAQEVEAIQAANTVAATQFTNDVAALKTAYAFLKGGGTPTLAQVSAFLQQLLRVLSVVTDDDQQPA